MYRKDVKGFLPELMEKMYNERVIFKKRMIKAKKAYEKTPTKELEKEIARCNNVQMSKKIALNSAYGAIGNQYFRYYKLANAEYYYTIWSGFYPLDRKQNESKDEYYSKNRG